MGCGASARPDNGAGPKPEDPPKEPEPPPKELPAAPEASAVTYSAPEASAVTSPADAAANESGTGTPPRGLSQRENKALSRLQGVVRGIMLRRRVVEQLNFTMWSR